MSCLRSTVLYDSVLVRVADVSCDAPRSGCGEEEWDSVVVVAVPYRGVFEVHRHGQTVVADVNTALVFGAGDHYRVSHPVAGGDRCTVLIFAPGVVEQALGGDGARDGLLRPATQLGARLLTAALGGGQADRLAAEEGALRVLSALAVDFGAAACPALKRTQRRRVEEVRSLLAGRPTAVWRLEGVARAVHCSPFHLARQFRAVTGETMSRYLLRLRLGLALHRLAEGETDLARLALDLGFAHHSHFSGRFRSVLGTTPAAARETLTRRRLGELSTILTAAPGEPPYRGPHDASGAP